MILASLNRVTLLGNTTRDIQVKYTTAGTAMAEMGVAVSRKWLDKQSTQWKEETTFVDVQLWGRQAEIAGEYLAKGRPVLIEGRLQLDQWDDKESGQKRSKLRVVCENLQLLGGKPSGERSERQTTTETTQANVSDMIMASGEEVPF